MNKVDYLCKMKYFVYKHFVEGDKFPFYIGFSSNKNRAYNFVTRTKEWFSIYNECDGKITVELIECSNKDEAKKLEIELILEFKRYLCNKANGGQSPSISVVLPKLKLVLENLGDNIKLARLRRNLSMTTISERSGISRPTLCKMENGDVGVSIVAYLNVLFVMGLENEISKIAIDDPVGKKILEVNLLAGRIKK